MNKKLLLVFSFLLFSFSHVFSQTNVSGNISRNTIWTKANSPYVLTGDVGIPSAYTLTIEPGVTVQRASDYQILINGTILFKGTQADSIIFSSNGTLTTNNKFFIEFQKSNLSASSLSYISFRNQSYKANNIRVGNESESVQTSPKNSGTLSISRSNLGYGYTATKGYQTTSSLKIDSCFGTSAYIIGYYPRSEPIYISNSSFYNSTINSDSYNYGITITNSYLKSCQLLLGCCDANFTISNSKLDESRISDGGGSRGPITISNTLLLNTSVDNLNTVYSISNSNFIVDKALYNSRGEAIKYIISAGNLNMSHTQILNLSSNNYSAINLSGYTGYDMYSTNTITENLFSNLYDAVDVTGFFAINLHNNNFKNISHYAIANYSNKDFSALNNYFELKPGKSIDDLIFDSNDDLKYGLVTYKPYSSTVVNNSPVSKPVNVLKVPQKNGVLVSWDKNQETNIKNYKVYWGYKDQFAYQNSSVVASTENSFVISGASVNDSIAVTALNTNSTGVDDQLNGFESWYARAIQPAPVLTSFTPTIAAGKTEVTLTGANLAEATQVTFGGIPAASFTVVSPTTIKAVVGAGASGAISVTTGGGTSTVNGFTFIPAPTITLFTPTSAGPGKTVTIYGTNFTGATTVLFGKTPATSFTAVSSTQITAVVDTGSTGSLTVTTPGGTVTKDGFVFVPKPVITSFTPVISKSGAVVTLTGKNFTSVTEVSFGGWSASTFTVVSPTTITAVVGRGATGNVSVTSPGGTAMLEGFTFIPAPIIESVSPQTAVKGASITISGLNFNEATAVSFGGIPAASFEVVSATSIKAVVGSGASGEVSVTTPGGTASVTGFTFIPAPTIASFTPGTATIGSSVTIVGTNFTGASAVSFGSTAAKTFTVVSPTTITAVLGSGSSGNVSVTTPGGTANASGFIFNYNLPANNFVITTNSATCKGSANGSVVIRAARNLDYAATITGGSLNATYTFTNGVTITNLAAGSYNICFTVAGLPNYQQCFTIVVTEPKDLEVYAAINKSSNNVTLNLAGANEYKVTLNGSTTITSGNFITLALAKGNNSLLVSTDKPCQGTFEKQINIPTTVVPYPNPFTSTVNINLGDETVANATISIYNLNNIKVYNKQYYNQSGLVTIDVSGLSSGVYMLKLVTDKNANTFKIIKDAK
jgi:hypothetical protein